MAFQPHRHAAKVVGTTKPFNGAFILLGLGRGVTLARQNQQNLFTILGKGSYQSFNIALGMKSIQAANGRYNSLNNFSAFQTVFSLST